MWNVLSIFVNNLKTVFGVFWKEVSFLLLKLLRNVSSVHKHFHKIDTTENALFLREKKPVCYQCFEYVAADGHPACHER